VSGFVRTLAARAVGETAGPAVTARRKPFFPPPLAESTGEAAREGRGDRRPPPSESRNATPVATVVFAPTPAAPTPREAAARPQPVQKTVGPARNSVRAAPRDVAVPGPPAFVENAPRTEATAAGAARAVPEPARERPPLRPAPTEPRPAASRESLSAAVTVRSDVQPASVMRPVAARVPDLPVRPEPRIDVHIDRIEIRASPAPQQPPRRPPAARPSEPPRSFARLAAARRHVDRGSL
jgi:hypothetical protein